MRHYQQSRFCASVGLEITPDVLRAMEIKIQARETVVQRMAQGDTPAGCVRDGRVVDAAALAVALRRLWQEGSFSTRRCSVALPVGTLTPQMLTVPPAPPAELRLIVGGELARFAAIGSDTPYGWLPMAGDGGPGGNMLAFMADAEGVAGYRQAAALAGLEIDLCEPDAVAALRTVELGWQRQGAAAAVFVSATCSEMAFLEAGRVRYYRRLDRGLAAAEEFPGREPEEAADDPALARFMANMRRAAPGGAARDPLGELALEIKRSLQYYGRAYGSAPQPEKILLLGDSPALERLAEVISTDLELAAEYLHPLHLYPHAPALTGEHLLSAGAQYAVALGTALRPLVSPQITAALDLKTRDEAQVLARAAPRYLTAALSGSTVVVLAALLASLSLGAQLSQARGELSAAEGKLRAAHAEAVSSVVQLRQARMATDRLRQAAMPVPQLMIHLGRLVPEGLALADLDLKADGSLTLEGEARAPQPVNRLLQRLFDDPRFRSPALDTLDSSSHGGTTHFKVETGLAGYGRATMKGEP